MLLTNEFVVPRPLDETWAVLTDLERIAPCMPGAQLTSVQGDDYHGKVKVKVGPMTAQFTGVATFKELDATAHRAVIDARGRDATGKGRASALVTATLTGEGDTTRVTVETDLSIAGPLAQMGRSTIGDISTRLLGQFATNLEAQLAATPPAPTTTTVEPAAAVAETPTATEVSEVDAILPAHTVPDASGATSAPAEQAAAAISATHTPTATATSAATPTSVPAATSTTTSASAPAGTPTTTSTALPTATSATTTATTEAPADPITDPPASAAQVAEVAAILPAHTVPDASGATTAPADQAAASIRIIDGPEAEPVDLLQTAGTGNLIKIAVPIILLIAVIAVIIWFLASN